MNTYLAAITLTRTLPCLAEPGKIIVIGEPSRPLDEVLPYLATLPSIIAWNPQSLTLTFRRPRGLMTLYRDKVNITQVKDTAEGLELLDALKAAINAVWERPMPRAFWKQRLIGIVSILGVTAWVLFTFLARTLWRLLPHWIPVLQLLIPSP